MKLFDPQPRITAADRQRITAAISNGQKARQWLKSEPPHDDVKRAIVIECDSARGPLRNDVLTFLLRRHSRIENMLLVTKITEHLTSKK